MVVAAAVAAVAVAVAAVAVEGVRNYMLIWSGEGGESEA